MKDAYWFPHDANARYDKNILLMRADHGWEGYGLYWAIIEILRDEDDHCFPWDKVRSIALDLNVEVDRAEKFIRACVDEYSLFQADEMCFWSPSLRRRMSKRQDISDKRRKAARSRFEKEQDETDDDERKLEANGKQTGKQNSARIREEKIRENKREYAEHVHLTEAEHRKLVEKYGEPGTKRAVEKLSNYKGAKGKRYKSDYRAILNWVVEALKLVEVQPRASPAKCPQCGKPVIGGYCECGWSA